MHVTWSGFATTLFPVPVPSEQFAWGSREYVGISATRTSEDPRVSGEITYVMVGDGPLPPDEADELSRFTSLARLENEGGAWQGPIIDVMGPDHQWVQYG